MRKHYAELLEFDMICIPGSGIHLVSMVGFCLLAFNGASFAEESSEPRRVYGADYSITPDISKHGAFVELRISQNEWLLRELSMPYDEKIISDIDGDGQILLDDGRIRWEVPADGGRLRWFARINHLRDNDTYDAFIGESWALFRAEDVIPPTATRTLRRAVSKTRLTFDLPDGWSSVTQYFKRSDVFDVSNPARRFDRPTGWIVLGKLGV